MPTIGLIDYGAGNFTSVFNALRYLGLNVTKIDMPAQMEQVSHLVLPGVGAFATVMRQLTRLHFVNTLRQQILEQGKPFLGICVGMQVLASLGREFEDCAGLDAIPGVVERIPTESSGLPLPHMGWNELQIEQTSPLFAGLPERPVFYFVHSYHLQPTYTANVLATCRYGTDLVAVVQNANIFGVQFHPEKSQRVGFQVLKNFLALS